MLSWCVRRARLGARLPRGERPPGGLAPPCESTTDTPLDEMRASPGASLDSVRRRPRRRRRHRGEPLPEELGSSSRDEVSDARSKAGRPPSSSAAGEGGVCASKGERRVGIATGAEAVAEGSDSMSTAGALLPSEPASVLARPEE